MNSSVCPSSDNVPGSGQNEPQKQQQQQQREEEGQPQQPTSCKKKRNLPGNPDPDAEVVALSPRTLMATNRFICEVCNKGFQRDQNLQLHRRGHNLPWKLRQRDNLQENVVRKRVYVCPEPTCIHHEPSRALGDLTGIKKHYYRKHGEKKWKCDRCSKRYAVLSDWKAHQKTCGTKEYHCDCGTLFSRKDSFITHRALCDVLTEGNTRVQLPSRLDESQESGGPDSTAPNMSPGAGEEPQSSQATQCSGGPVEPPLEVFKQTMAESLPSVVHVEGVGTALASRWMLTNFCAPGLSLSLGMGPGPGPGPPDVVQVSGNQSLLKPISLGLPACVSSAVPYLPGSSNVPTDLMSSFTTYLSQGPTYENDKLNVNPSRSPSHLGHGIGSIYGFDIGDASFKSPLCRNASASISATALLQKAALMGATSSNNYLLRNLGRAMEGPSSIPQSQDTWTGPKSFMSSSLPVNTRKQGQKTSLTDDDMPSLGKGALPIADSVSVGVEHSSHSSHYVHEPESLPEGQRIASSFMPCLPYADESAPSHRRLRSMECRRFEGDRPMLDFLGVGAAGRLVGTAGDIGHSISHRDLTKIILNTSVKTEASFDKIDSML